jgi:Fur family zinc uptake transcriptional regulator
MAQSHAHTHAANRPCAPQDTDAFLAEAEALVVRQGQRMTRIRRKVLRLLLESEGPSKAYDLLANLDGEGSAKPPTIYRALDFLQTAGLVHKIESLNAYVACGHTSHSHSAVFLICEVCEEAEELHAVATSRALKAETEAAGFAMTRAVIEVRGRCGRCAS